MLKENIQYILTDLWNVHLVNVGIFITIFTILYAFIVSKKNELKAITELIKFDQALPETYQKEKFAISYIDNLKAIINKCLKICVLSFILGLTCWISVRVLICYYDIQVLSIILCFSTFCLLIYSFCIFIKIYKIYKKQTKM